MRKLIQEEIDSYLDAVGEQFFKQRGWKNLEPSKLGLIRVNLIPRLRSDEIDQDTFNQLDHALKVQMGIEE